jgi:MscS family membrane protein
MTEMKILPTSVHWSVELLIGVLFLLLLSFGLKKAVDFLHKKSLKSEGFWKKKVRYFIHMPLQIAIWGFGIAYVIEVFAGHFGVEQVVKYIHPFRNAFIVSCITWVVQRWINEGFKHLAKKSEKLGVAPGTLYALSKLTSFILVILALLIIFPMFGMDVAPLLAFGGIGVAGIAFAAQDMIANFFGGAMLHFTRIFSIGDQIAIPSKENFRGIVKEIGWYITLIEDYDRRPVYFPNALFTKSQVINETRRTHRRINETVSIRYDDLPNVEAIVVDLRKEIAAHPKVDASQSFGISLSGYGDYGIDILLYLLVQKMPYPQFMQVKQELLMIVAEVIQRHEAEFCYPTSNVNITQFPPQK